MMGAGESAALFTSDFTDYGSYIFIQYVLLYRRLYSGLTRHFPPTLDVQE